MHSTLFQSSLLSRHAGCRHHSEPLSRVAHTSRRSLPGCMRLSLRHSITVVAPDPKGCGCGTVWASPGTQYIAHSVAHTSQKTRRMRHPTRVATIFPNCYRTRRGFRLRRSRVLEFLHFWLGFPSQVGCRAPKGRSNKAQANGLGQRRRPI